MSYGAQSNAPWQRNMMQGHPQSGGFHQGSQMFMPNAQQNNMAAFGHGGMQGGGNFPGSGGGNSVAYPQPRSGLNPVAFQQGGSGQSHYNSIGTVTKISIDCGLVNDEVFFYRNVCKGPEPKLGDRVIFEATYSNNGQFKWNATRVQLMQQTPLMGSNKGSYGTVAATSDYPRSQIRRNSPNRSPVRGRHERDNRERERLHRSRDKDEDEHERKRRREDRSRDRGTAANNRGAGGHAAARGEKERDRGDSRKKEREVTDKDREERARDLDVQRTGPKSRRTRRVKHYMVQIPKSLLTIKTADVQDLRRRYSSLYIPSDFFLTNIKWSDTFTPDNPFSLRRPCQFHIMHETVENPTEQNLELLEPADANYLYSAKVMLMSLPPITEIYKKCFENDEDDADHHTVHPSRLINFLVGMKGRVGSMAIGGPWSPSLDGENPDKDPSVLIRTAIRTCKALTGIDLSNCTQWYRFVELYYHRTEYKSMEKDGPPRVETVVIYLPDVHSCMPSIEEWQTLSQVYKSAADDVIARRSALVAAAAANTTDYSEKANDVEMTDSSTLANDDAEQEDAEEKSTENDEIVAESNCEAEDVVTIDDDEPEEQMDVSTASADVSGATENDAEGSAAEEEERADHENTAEDENDEPAPEPTHYSLLDLKTMKVPEIRDELLARNLPEKGVRNVIMARLAKALNTEKSEEIRSKIKARQQLSPQKTAAAKKPTTSNNKAKSDGEKMDGDKKGAATKKHNEKKEASDAKGKTTKSPNNKKHIAKGKSDNKDDTDDWADAIDFELSDIVILDEYDSSKNAEETNLKEMTEKEKSQLIRHYTLPDTPHIIVHPNRQAKSGRFDCAVASLSLLLDYHPDDSKERFFEVSLFAELFNDMLMRDFGFNIYKHIYLHKEPETSTEITELKNESNTKVEKTETADESKKETKDKADEKDKSSKKDSKSSNGDKSGKDQKNDDTHSVKSESRKRKLSTSTSTANGKDNDKSESDKKMVVVKPELLLSFIYFDTNYCGYIIDKHLEDLFYVLGLNLSRSQIRTVLAKLGKLVTPQPIYYRKLTDKEESLVSAPVIEGDDDMPLEELKRLASGNNQYESVFGKTTIANQVSAIGGENDQKDGLINFNGTVVNVGKLLNQINRTEKSYSDLEKLHNDLMKQHSDLQKDYSKSTTKVKDLQTEIKSVSRKLTDSTQDFYSLNRKYRDQNATLSYIYTRVAPYFVREKDKEKEAKSEGSRDKDKDNKEKEKDKSKEKECDKDKEKTKEEKDKEIKKESTKEENEKDAVKDESDKEKPKEEKQKSKEEKEKPKDEKEKSNEEKEKPKEEKEKPKDEKEKVKEEKDKPKDVKEKQQEKVKDDKEKQQDKVKDVKETIKEQTKTQKEKPKEDKQKEKAKDDKEKPIPTKDDKAKPVPTKDDKAKPTPTKDDKAKPTVQRNISKPSTPAAKKLNESKPTGKIIRKSDNIGTKK